MNLEKTYYTPPKPEEEPGLPYEEWKARFLEGGADIWDLPQTMLELLVTDLPQELQFQSARIAAEELQKNPYACGKEGRILLESFLSTWKYQETSSIKLMSFLCDITKETTKGSDEHKHLVDVLARCIRQVLPSFRNYSDEIKRIVDALSLWTSSLEDDFPEEVLQDLNALEAAAARGPRVTKSDLVYRNAVSSTLKRLSQFLSLKTTRRSSEALDVLIGLQSLYATNLTGDLKSTEWQDHYHHISEVLCQIIREEIPSAEDIGLRSLQRTSKRH